MRLPDWRGRLAAYLDETARTAFRPGKHDCALFAAGAVHAMTGTDHAKGWRGYRTLAEGRKRLAEKGYADHIALIADTLEEIPPSLAAAGDLAIVEGDDDAALGVVLGEMISVLRPDGRGLVPLTDAKRAFRV